MKLTKPDISWQTAKRLYASLTADGAGTIGVISGAEGKDADMLNYVYSTYKAVFDHAQVYALCTIPARTVQNLLLVVSMRSIDTARCTQTRSIARLPNVN